MLFGPPPFILAAATQTFTYFRWEFTQTSGTEVILAEVNILVGGASHPSSAMTSNTAPSPYVAAASLESGGQDAYMALDNINSTYWHAGAAMPQHIQVYLGSGGGVAATGYEITAYDGVSRAFDPEDWTLLGSNTGAFSGEEVTLDTVTGETGWSAGEKRAYTI